MQDEAPGLNSRRWQAVDSTGTPEFFVGYLDKAAVGLRAARAAMMQALDVQVGHSVLDVGCGTGEFFIELAATVPGLRAVGIDSSRALVGTAIPGLLVVSSEKPTISRGRQTGGPI